MPKIRIVSKQKAKKNIKDPIFTLNIFLISFKDMDIL